MDSGLSGGYLRSCGQIIMKQLGWKVRGQVMCNFWQWSRSVASGYKAVKL